MTLKEKIITMADEVAKEFEAIPANINNVSENIGKLKVLNELMKFMLDNNL